MLEALHAGRSLRRVLIAESAHGASLDSLIEAARWSGIPVERVARARLDERAGDHHQGVAAEAAPFRYTSLDEILELAEKDGKPPLLLALDSVQDPQNLGTLLRTALATGTHGVLLPEHRAVGITPAVSKASAGAVEHLAVARVTNLTRGLQSLKARGVWTYGLAVDGATPFWEVDWTSSCALVVGAEGPGLGRLIRETCDALVHAPMESGSIQSLNAATAGSLVLYEAFRQRHRNGNS